jgi:RNA polymerase sigma factor (sigma-70 family)
VVANDEEKSAWLAARSGDAEAFASIFDLHSDRIYSYARRLTSTQSDAEDVVAAAFLELWRRRKAVRLVDGSVLPGLLLTTTNVTRNLVRSLRRYRSMLATLPRGSVAPGADQMTLEKIQAEEVRTGVQEALKSLKPKDAALVALTVFEGLTPAQAAMSLGISAGNARTRLHRARAQIGKEFGTSPEGIAREPGWEGVS